MACVGAIGLPGVRTLEVLEDTSDTLPNANRRRSLCGMIALASDPTNLDNSAWHNGAVRGAARSRRWTPVRRARGIPRVYRQVEREKEIIDSAGDRPA